MKITAIFVIACAAVSPALANDYYWCDQSHSYYGQVASCAGPWRKVITLPNGTVQYGPPVPVATPIAPLGAYSGVVPNPPAEAKANSDEIARGEAKIKQQEELEAASKKQAEAAEEANAKRQMIIARRILMDNKNGYKSMSFEDLKLDAKKLAQDESRVAVDGVYVKDGRIEEIFASERAQEAARLQINSDAGIALITDDADRETRKYLYQCRNSNITPHFIGIGGSVSCPLRFLGHVSSCTTSFLASSIDEPCLILDSAWYMPALGSSEPSLPAELATLSHPILGTRCDAGSAKNETLEHISGCRIVEVKQKSAGARAGLRAGDIIILLNGMQITNADDLVVAEEEAGAGKTVPIGLIRGGEHMDFMVTLGSSNDDQTAPLAEPAHQNVYYPSANVAPHTPGQQDDVPKVLSRPSELESRARSSVESIVTDWSKPNAEAIPAVQAAYSATIQFYGKSTINKAVVDQKISFMNHWDIRNYKIEPQSLHANCNDSDRTCDVYGTMSWDAQSTESHVHSWGHSTFEYGLSLQGGTFLITKEEGTTTERHAEKF